MLMIIKNNEQLEKIRKAGRILAQVAKVVLTEARESVTLRYLDKLAERLIKEAGAEPAFLNYRPYGTSRPYPFSICASINETVVHGMPNDYKLRSGDLLKLDFGAKYEGWNADAAWTIGIGELTAEAKKLVKVTEKALFEGIKQAKAGKTLGDIGWAIGRTAKKYGFSVAEGLTGHGIGKDLHEDPNVFNEGEKGRGMQLRPGLVLAIEPMINAGSGKIIQKKDDSFVTADGGLSAHFEHTVAITEKGPQILTMV